MARAIVFDWVRQANRSDTAVGDADLREMLGVLALENLLEVPADVAPPPEAVALLKQRTAARAQRDWTRADAIRGRLAELGWEVRDGPAGPNLVRRG
jgi:cysteinyl-tRNA synthetase